MAINLRRPRRKTKRGEFRDQLESKYEKDGWSKESELSETEEMECLRLDNSLTYSYDRSSTRGETGKRYEARSRG